MELYSNERSVEMNGKLILGFATEVLKGGLALAVGNIVVGAVGQVFKGVGDAINGAIGDGKKHHDNHEHHNS